MRPRLPLVTRGQTRPNQRRRTRCSTTSMARYVRIYVCVDSVSVFASVRVVVSACAHVFMRNGEGATSACEFSIRSARYIRYVSSCLVYLYLCVCLRVCRCRCFSHLTHFCVFRNHTLASRPCASGCSRVSVSVSVCRDCLAPPASAARPLAWLGCAWMWLACVYMGCVTHVCVGWRSRSSSS